MCTAITLNTNNFYFGRTLDNDRSYGEQVVVTPRAYPFFFRSAGTLKRHLAFIGTAHISGGYPLYYDAVNEEGLCMAGLNFPSSAVYNPRVAGSTNLAQFELIPYILGRCKSVKQAEGELENINITHEQFSPAMPPASLHWIVADKGRCIVVESTRHGLEIHENAVGVLTNEPPFASQLANLSYYMALSPEEPENTFCPRLNLAALGRGFGAYGLPGDLTSPSRFVRAAFARGNSVCGDGEEDSVSQFFHILDFVGQPRGACAVGSGYESTIYSSCCNATRGIYYFTTYGCRCISAVNMYAEELESARLSAYNMQQPERINKINY